MTFALLWQNLNIMVKPAAIVCVCDLKKKSFCVNNQVIVGALFI